ncbi:MAG: hypothetical protein JOZ81_35150 [Chloroflexi bacterium]|nr:hypothetical protein [Chloroflexota bacterium]
MKRRNHAQLHAQQPGSPQATARETEATAGAPREDGVSHFIPQDVYLAQRIPLAGVAYRAAPVDSEPTIDECARRNCNTHDLDNVYVVDASFFPSSSSVNPALTIASAQPRRPQPLGP